jgi:hypothetical protein
MEMQVQSHPPLNLQRTEVKNSYRYEGPFPGVPNSTQPISQPTVIIEKLHVKDSKPYYTITIVNQPQQEIKINSDTYSMVRDVLKFFDAPNF